MSISTGSGSAAGASGSSSWTTGQSQGAVALSSDSSAQSHVSLVSSCPASRSSSSCPDAAARRRLVTRRARALRLAARDSSRRTARNSWSKRCVSGGSSIQSGGRATVLVMPAIETTGHRRMPGGGALMRRTRARLTSTKIPLASQWRSWMTSSGCRLRVSKAHFFRAFAPFCRSPHPVPHKHPKLSSTVAGSSAVNPIHNPRPPTIFSISRPLPLCKSSSSFTWMVKQLAY
mmetsp:Transcript_61818/g.165604  ORF Transcript_61818/g.165604 Transcript_61818/m.165604 type:complete len:232 (-) Transcript_61818:417-1112(-)